MRNKDVVDIKIIAGAVVILVIMAVAIYALLRSSGNGNVKGSGAASSTYIVTNASGVSTTGTAAADTQAQQPCNACLTKFQYTQLVGSGGLYNSTNQSGGFTFVKVERAEFGGIYQNLSALWIDTYILYNVSDMVEVNGVPTSGNESSIEYIDLFNSSEALQAQYSKAVQKAVNDTPQSSNPPGASNAVNKVYDGFTYSYFPTKKLGFDGNYTPATTTLCGYEGNYYIYYFDSGEVIPQSQLVAAIAQDINIQSAK